MFGPSHRPIANSQVSSLCKSLVSGMPPSACFRRWSTDSESRGGAYLIIQHPNVAHESRYKGSHRHLPTQNGTLRSAISSRMTEDTNGLAYQFEQRFLLRPDKLTPDDKARSRRRETLTYADAVIPTLRGKKTTSWVPPPLSPITRDMKVPVVKGPVLRSLCQDTLSMHFTADETRGRRVWWRERYLILWYLPRLRGQVSGNKTANDISPLPLFFLSFHDARDRGRRVTSYKRVLSQMVNAVLRESRALHSDARVIPS